MEKREKGRGLNPGRAWGGKGRGEEEGKEQRDGDREGERRE